MGSNPFEILWEYHTDFDYPFHLESRAEIWIAIGFGFRERFHRQTSHMLSKFSFVSPGFLSMRICADLQYVCRSLQICADSKKNARLRNPIKTPQKCQTNNKNKNV